MSLTPARRTAAATAGVFTPLFALPLLIDPYRWARAFGWRPEPGSRCSRSLRAASPRAD